MGNQVSALWEFVGNPPLTPPKGRGILLLSLWGKISAIASIAFSEAAVGWGFFIL